MDTTATGTPRIEPSAPLPQPTERTDYLNAGHTVSSWLLTLDHKRIGILYLVSITIAFILGGIFAAGVRLELATPRGDLFTSDTYNKLFTMHGIMMLFFFLIPSIPATLGNFVLPMMLGAKDLAFPRINLLSWYIFVVAFAFTMWAILQGGVDTGWTFYTPYSSTYSNTYVMAAAVGVLVSGFSSILTGLNFVVTIHKMRAPGLTWTRLPLFVWAMYATSIIMLLGTPVVGITIVLVALERGLGFGIFDPRLGGDPILFQHMFWFYSHPAVYIMILPALGVVSEVVSTFSRKELFGYRVLASASMAIAIIGFLVWGHHMYVSGQSEYAGLIFSVLTFLVAVPSGVKVFSWLATMYKGSISLRTPMLYSLAFMGLFTIGGVTGLPLATMGTDVHLHDTYFVVAHFHYIMVGGAITGFLAGIHYWWPKMTGRMYSEGIAQVSTIIVFIGFNLTFFPQFLLGFMGMPRRYHDYGIASEWQILNLLSTAGATILAVGYLLPMIYLTWSLFFGAKAPDNPWGASTLEWQTPSPPAHDNFEETPVVTTDPYHYQQQHKETTLVG